MSRKLNFFGDRNSDNRISLDPFQGILSSEDEEIIFEDDSEDESDDRFAPSPIMDAGLLNKKRQTNILVPTVTAARASFIDRNDVFNTDILRLAGVSKTTRIQDKAEKESFGLFNIEAERNTFKKVNTLRYRENMFRAAARLTDELPSFPKWVYRDKPEESLELVKFIVGGAEYQSFEDTIVNIPNTKLARCVIEHNSGEPILFFDRDAACFNSVLNFYRTGRLHAPSNACLSFFEEELEFWGINEEFMEPCCYSAYMAYKKACNTLKKFSENKESQNQTRQQTSVEKKIKTYLHNAFNVGNATILSQWYFTIYGVLTLISVIIFLLQTYHIGRIDNVTLKYRSPRQNESVIQFFSKTQINKTILSAEFFLSIYFLLDLFVRYNICPNKFVFWSDTINWIDLLSSISTLLSNLFYIPECFGYHKTFMMIFKLSRILLLFKINSQLKTGTEAFILTLRASSNELLIVFLITIIFILVFGVLIFVIEMVSETDTPSKYTTIVKGMWWALVTMATVGYGDYVPSTTGGYVVGWICIMFGIVIYQLPVPIFLNTFSIYYNQVQARLNHQDKHLNSSVDPEMLLEPLALKLRQKELLKMKRFTISN